MLETIVKIEISTIMRARKLVRRWPITSGKGPQSNALPRTTLRYLLKSLYNAVAGRRPRSAGLGPGVPPSNAVL